MFFNRRTGHLNRKVEYVTDEERSFLARQVAAGNMVSTAHQDAGDVDPAELARVEDDFAAQAEKILRESARYCECVGGERYGG